MLVNGEDIYYVYHLNKINNFEFLDIQIKRLHPTGKQSNLVQEYQFNRNINTDRENEWTLSCILWKETDDLIGYGGFYNILKLQEQRIYTINVGYTINIGNNRDYIEIKEAIECKN